MSAAPEPDKRLDVVLSEALRALAHQQSLLDNLGSRATVLTTAAALVKSEPWWWAVSDLVTVWPVGRWCQS
ncbi:hypothetical protein HH310_26675 [Actinoplanes sp. TBRC 11911]|uniref:hypothetical protein n=1 Tax=Actinoplanes sp. TBRC 11911 TaxID=2729386 RepID=UPI00145CCE5A|nr:hypothetical protein [Actinoplanes sp. TBRC 11911]NMO54759.1 hypothetical protein [Actinoplanes sp. TBRC 11911]